MFPQFRPPIPYIRLSPILFSTVLFKRSENRLAKLAKLSAQSQVPCAKQWARRAKEFSVL
ncbi:hypothetical protein MYCTH_2304424 [Thermothelomyces thermophilus ATCC 42464]|uniref:Uncharacterized protein n=1 Tax=Thermothelomyces thermophilus (strain ATCC 42464 / BCRC 31852 / DSM 1799) TaxID=573729 RepID=G2QEL2_THET4|nr:uncharacterized protein MYCTH_2304424 [Thermothelomyces thermophilus ATCC 42464]AEO57795.1 hypothetical protein MYCTH_2304424 [Thermothelomyces thermophilus ATCC 42464]